MECGDCQEFLSEYLDGETDLAVSASIDAHLSVCLECRTLFDDFAVILGNCRTADQKEARPPNPDALWCRINNVIEAETTIKQEEHVEPRGWFVRGRKFTYSQIGSAVLAVALISSLLTIVAVRNYFEPTGDDNLTRSSETQTTFEKVLSSVGLIDSPEDARKKRVAEQYAVIDYWNKRISSRRQQWDARMRDAFDRNLREIDTAVHEHTLTLEKDPNDELSGEMLDSALNEKMNLLREFSEL